MTNTHARRGRLPIGSTSVPALPKSTCASSPGAVCTRTTALGLVGSSVRTKRRIDE